MQQMPNAKALSHGRDTTIDVLGRQPMFSAGKASSSVTFALKYWVFGFWNTLPTSGGEPVDRHGLHIQPARGLVAGERTMEE